MRRNGALAADYARRHDVPRWYDDADELINDPGVDAVYVATPPDSHSAYVLRAAQAGKPVYVEKPMARTAVECEQMVSACAEAGVGLFVAYYRRAMPRFVKVKELLEGGRIGQLRSVSIRNERPAPVGCEADQEGWRVHPEISGGGHFVDLGSHILDLLDWLLGPVTHAAGVATNRGGRYQLKTWSQLCSASVPVWKESVSGTTTPSSTKIKSRSSERRERCVSPASPVSPCGCSLPVAWNRSRRPIRRPFNCRLSRPWSMR